jgi:excisionase family DNA binding protein
MEPLLNLEETAGVLRMSIPTIRLWTYQGKLPVVKMGRKCLFRRSDREDFVLQHTRPAIKNPEGEF